MTVKAITLRAQWGLPLLAGTKWIETRPRNVRHRGRTAVHLSKTQTEFWRIWHAGHQQAYTDEARITTAIGHLELTIDDLEEIFGCVAGSVEIFDCLPIVGLDPGNENPRFDHDVCVVTPSGRLVLAGPIPAWSWREVTNQLPFGDFTPGRYAVLTRRPAMCFDRCPYCWGSGAHPDVAVNACQVTPVTSEDLAAVTTIIDAAKRQLAPCPVCETAGHCDPVPARGQRSVPWNWNPEAP